MRGLPIGDGTSVYSGHAHPVAPLAVSETVGLRTTEREAGYPRPIYVQAAHDQEDTQELQ
ncbi:hypothetical protein ACFPRL_02895 [Pseudoclavibacter helvolus]